MVNLYPKSIHNDKPSGSFEKTAAVFRSCQAPLTRELPDGEAKNFSFQRFGSSLAYTDSITCPNLGSEKFSSTCCLAA